MIAYPSKWNQDYSLHALKENLTIYGDNIDEFIFILTNILKKININNLAYSGGIDSTIILRLLSEIFNNVNTYTMSCRTTHPDIIYARIGSKNYQSIHNEIIINSTGGQIYKQFFENVGIKKIIHCDGIDEFMCGYWDHVKNNENNYDYDKYEYYLSVLTKNHLKPLNNESKNIKVYLPYLSSQLITFMKAIPINNKCGKLYWLKGMKTKKFMREVAKKLGIHNDFIERPKYAFSEAFIRQDKKTVDIA